MVLDEKKWERVANYIISQVKEYCLEHNLDKEDFSKKLGISSRVLTRLYSKKLTDNGVKNNRLITSLEFLYNISNALDISIVKLISHINDFVNEDFENEKSIDIFEKISGNLIIDEISKAFKSTKNTLNKFNKISILINISFIMYLSEKNTLKEIIDKIKLDVIKSEKFSDCTRIIKFLNVAENELI